MTICLEGLSEKEYKAAFAQMDLKWLIQRMPIDKSYPHSEGESDEPIKFPHLNANTQTAMQC